MDINVVSNVFKQEKNDVNRPIHQSKRPKPMLTPTVATIVAKVVTACKLVNDELIPVGKYGFALAGDVKLNYYQLLLYGSKSSVLDNLIITKEFNYNVNENNTVRFLSKENWVLEFSNIDDAVDFNSRLAFVLWKLNGSKELFWMDLYYPVRDKVTTFNSIVEITYVVNVVQGTNFGLEVSNNKDDRCLKVKVSEEGWERSLLGVNDNTRRIVYIPVAEMGAWKILTDGRQCLCLTVIVNNVYEIKENKITDLAVLRQEPLVTTSNSIPIQLKEVVDNNLIVETVGLSKAISIESLYKDFEKLKIDNITTNERLLKLEALVEEKKSDKTETSNNIELKKYIKIVYKSIIQEFPVDQTFSGSKIQTTIKDIFSNTFDGFIK